MKNLLGLLVAAGVFGFFAMQEDANSETFFDKMMNKDGPSKTENAQIQVDAYSNATQDRIDAEFAN